MAIGGMGMASIFPKSRIHIHKFTEYIKNIIKITALACLQREDLKD
jgi:hypothetical protein